MSTTLSVNLNKIALVRNSRGHNYPDIAEFGRLALNSGAHGLTIHPRPDQRHAKYSDISLLKSVVDEFPGTELNIEGNPTEKFIEEVIKGKPHQCTLVPDEPDQLTSDHGWDLIKDGNRLTDIITRLKSAGIRVSIFMDPDPELIKLAPETGTDRIELYTEDYAKSYGTDDNDEILNKYALSAKAAQETGLEVNAGHDLNLENLKKFLSIPDIKEVSIGHALTVEALTYGFESVIKKYSEIVK